MPDLPTMCRRRLSRSLRACGSPSPSAGFTLIEMVVVVAIVGLLASMAVPLAEVTALRVKERSLVTGLRQIRQALDAHRVAVQAKRIAHGADGTPWPASLEVLVDGVPLLDEEGRPRADGSRLFLLRRMPRDPFAGPEGSNASTWGVRASTSGPNPPMPGADVFDVYSRSPRTGLDGSRVSDW